MIVTCPSCSSKYRVRDEAVPPEGAELQCPTCSSVFMAHAPKPDVDGLAAALEKMTRARDTAEQRVADLERTVAGVRAGGDDVVSLARAREEMARAENRATSADATIRKLNDELAKARLIAGDQSELLSVKQALFDTQRKQKTTSAELEVANALIASLQADVKVLRAGNSPAAQSEAAKKIAALQVELEKVRADQALQQSTIVDSGPPSAAAANLIAAVGPMLWGLEQSISYLEQFASTEATLAGHVRQLRLLQKVLSRIAEAS